MRLCPGFFQLPQLPQGLQTRRDQCAWLYVDQNWGYIDLPVIIQEVSACHLRSSKKRHCQEHTSISLCVEHVPRHHQPALVAAADSATTWPGGGWLQAGKHPHAVYPAACMSSSSRPPAASPASLAGPPGPPNRSSPSSSTPPTAPTPANSKSAAPRPPSAAALL